MTAPEFARPLRLDAIGAGDRHESVVADAAERAALVRRFDLAALDRLAGELDVRREAAGIRVRGRVMASLAQTCSVTGEPLPITLDTPVDLLFVADAAGGEEEAELSEADCDVVFHDGSAIDLGEAVAETMALALDPFPRGPGAAAALGAAGVLTEGDAGPFAALAALKGKATP